ncbi:MAG: protein translocase subunit SecD [Proteobacteria bacterium]|nr:protein translocase subunit SecD [Pseudomonadota bacterium]MDA1057314.1 protein translocase subunit SecD [Pseudomonadota bacterium]
MLQFARWKTTLVALVVAAGIIFLLPNFFPRASVETWPNWLPNEQINLGLDLQGGSHLLLEVDVDFVIRERLESLESEVRRALRAERINYTGIGLEQNSVRVRLITPEQRDDAVRVLRSLSQPIVSSAFLNIGARDLDVEVDDEGVARLTLTDEAITERGRAAVEQSIEIVRRRIDETGTREPSIQRQGDDRILVQLPGLDDPDRIKRLLGQTARLTFQMVDTEARSGGRVPPGSVALPADTRSSSGQTEYIVRREIMISGENLITASTTFDQQSGGPAVSFRFDAAGGRRFGQATTDNVGRPFAIVLDGKVISAPVIRQPILGGSGIITGGFSVQEANDLSILLRAGALPAPLNILEERSVGPGLGADSVAAGELASVIAFLAVMVFMVMAYGLFGVVANVALLVNMILIGGGLSLLQATLTLPGIAGVVLTIGMAVDANVLIFERIREEVRTGKTPIAAIDAGYSRALSTIVDANVTTLIAAIILFQFGSGPIKGFAVTLAFGIASSMFTAITLSRLIVISWMRWRRPATLPI